MVHHRGGCCWRVVLLVFIKLDIALAGSRRWHSTVVVHFTCNEKVPSSILGVSWFSFCLLQFLFCRAKSTSKFLFWRATFWKFYIWGTLGVVANTGRKADDGFALFFQLLRDRTSHFVENATQYQATVGDGRQPTLRLDLVQSQIRRRPFHLLGLGVVFGHFAGVEFHQHFFEKPMGNTVLSSNLFWS